MGGILDSVAHNHDVYRFIYIQVFRYVMRSRGVDGGSLHDDPEGPRRGWQCHELSSTVQASLAMMGLSLCNCGGLSTLDKKVV